MIHVTKFDGSPLLLNADWIQSVEETPDTIITLTTGAQLLVKNTAKEIEKLFFEYKQRAQMITQKNMRSGHGT